MFINIFQLYIIYFLMLTSIINFTNIKHFLIMFYMFIFLIIFAVIDLSGEKLSRQRQNLLKTCQR